MKKNNLIKNDKMTKYLKRVDRALTEMQYAPNTKRLYHWQATMFLNEAAKNITEETVDRVAFLYLKKLQKKKSRTYFLQACSAVDITLRHALRIPLSEETLRKAQSLK